MIIETGAVWWYTRGPVAGPVYRPIIRRSRYQLGLRGTRRSRARSLMVSGARPGGTPRHFCVPA